MIKTGIKFPLAMAAVALLGSVGTPAVAAKKEKPAAAAKQAPVEMSKEFRVAAGDIQKAIAAKDFAGAQAKVDAAVAIATMPDEKYFLGSMRVGIGQGTNNETMLRQGVNEMIAAGSKQATNLLQL